MRKPNTTKLDNVIWASSRTEYMANEKPLLELNYVCWRSFNFFASVRRHSLCIHNISVTNVLLKRNTDEMKKTKLKK